MSMSNAEENGTSFWSVSCNLVSLSNFSFTIIPAPNRTSATTVIDNLQRVMNAAARLVSDTREYDPGLSQLLYVELYWLDVADRVKFKLGLTVQSTGV